MKRSVCIVCFLALAILGLLVSTALAEFNQAHTELMKTLESLKPSGTAKVLIAAEKKQYEPFEDFDLRFRVSEDSYIALMHISTTGDITFFAPSYWIPASVKGNKVYSIKDFNIPIQVEPPGGIETINLFCSKTPINLFEANIDKDHEFYQIQHDDEAKLAALTEKLKQLDKSEWSGSGVVVNIDAPQEPKGTRGLPGVLIPPISTTGTSGYDVLFPPIETTGTSGHSEESIDPTE